MKERGPFPNNSDVTGPEPVGSTQGNGFLRRHENKILISSTVVTLFVGPIVPIVGGVAISVGGVILVNKARRAVAGYFRQRE